MDPEIKQLLKDQLVLIKDNHLMLRRIRHEAWVHFALKLIFWAVMILVPLYYLEPYLKLLPSISQLQDNIKQLQQYQK